VPLRPHPPLRFWQCQPPGYTAPPESARQTVSFSFTLDVTNVAWADIDASAMAAAMQTEINKKLAADGLAGTVTADKGVDPTAGRHRLTAGGQVIKMKFVVVVSPISVAASVWAAGHALVVLARQPAALPAART
jgi:hypothetical protein